MCNEKRDSELNSCTKKAIIPDCTDSLYLTGPPHNGRKYEKLQTGQTTFGRPKFIDEGFQNRINANTLEFSLAEEKKGFWKVSLPKSKHKYFAFIALHCQNAWARFH